MFKRIRTIITKPSLVFMYVKDKKSKVIRHLLFMGILLTLPFIMLAFVAPTNLFPDANVMTHAMNSHISNKEISIKEGKLINEDNKTKGFYIDNYLVVVGDDYKNASGYVVVFEEDQISVKYQLGKLFNFNYNSYKYTDLNLENIDFTYNNSREIALVVVNLLSSQKMILTSIVFSNFIYIMITYLTLALILALFARMSNRMPLSFGLHFKIAMYINTVWAITTLILTLFGYADLEFIALIIVYIYHFRAYNSVRLVKKVEVRKKDDE